MTDKIDLSKIQPGDEVTCKFTVMRWEAGDIVDDEGDVRVEHPNGKFRWIHRSAIVSHTTAPKPLAVGDRVRAANNVTQAVIKAIDRDRAWVLLADGSYETCVLSALERAE